ncbi:E3 ubiquitin-protein ligase RNF4-like isoform X2 [Stigmatopora nigra]
MDNPPDDPAEVVDLTSESWEAAHVVDLTNNDSVLLVDEGSPVRTRGRTRARTLTGRLSDPGGGDDGGRRNPPGGSYVVSSDEDEPSSGLPGADVLFSLQAGSSTRLTPGTISCPVCMDTYTEMVESGRLVVSTKCGHVFCSQCLRDALSRSHTCPTCRKRLTPRQYHPLYI